MTFSQRYARPLAVLALALVGATVAFAVAPAGAASTALCIAAFLTNIFLLVTAFVLTVVGAVMALFVRSREAVGFLLAGLLLAAFPFALSALVPRGSAFACF